MWRVYGGAVALVAGIAALIEAGSHHRSSNLGGGSGFEGFGPHPATGLSGTAYDLIRIGGWALIILGALTVIVGLIGYSGKQRAT